MLPIQFAADGEFIPLVHVKTEIKKNVPIDKCSSVFTLNWKQPPNFNISLISVWIVAYILPIPLSEAIWSLCSNKPKI
jgi:hypothetical protein